MNPNASCKVRSVTPSELSRLRSAWCEGVTLHDLERRFGIPRGRIKQECSDVPRPTPTPRRNASPRIQRLP